MTPATDAERVVAGTAMLETAEFDNVASVVAASDFQHIPSRTVFTILAELRAENAEINAAAVLLKAQQTERVHDLAPHGEAAVFLAELVDLAGTGANGMYAARVVREAAAIADADPLWVYFLGGSLMIFAWPILLLWGVCRTVEGMRRG